MNAELEELLKSLQATYEVHRAEDVKRLLAIYNLKLKEASERLGVSQVTLDIAVREKRFKWLRAQQGPSSMPPKA
jgi:predicted DNA-binding protein (UPF0251 family)